MARTSSSFRIEGGLFPSDFVERLTSRPPTLEGLAPTDYGKSDVAERDEAIQMAFQQTLNAWRRFESALEQAPNTETQTSLTRERFLLPLFEALGYGRLPAAKVAKVGDRSYPISHQWMNVPIHLLGVAVDLDRRSPGVRGAAQATPHGMVQEYLNASDQVLWAVLSNGSTLRLLRDHKSLTRNAYLEFDLERICKESDYSSFAVLWLLLHSSRAASETLEDLWWEKWYGQARQDGVRALDRLQGGVQRAIEALGSGFLAHPQNVGLREALKTGELSTQAYYRLLLRLIYRMLFLFVAEDREVLLLSKDDYEDARRRYTEHYGTGRLRHLAASIRGTQHGDLWQCLRLVMDKLGSKGCGELALPDLGSSFWGREQLGALAECQLRNEDLLTAVRALAFTEQNGVLHPVRYRDLGATEFGSVYESLLELRPEHVKAERFTLATSAGNERKTTGAYYTPDSLVQCLLDSALDPLLVRCREQSDPEAALLDLKVCDPACGSGHFLVAAAHRIAKALAQVRSGDDEPSPTARREAMRDVVQRCIYGVDLSEMAVELCKVNLWLEAQAPDLPLAFLDAHVQQGNSLLGTTQELMRQGIPDAAMDALLGDDKDFCKQLKAENRAWRRQGGTMFDQQGKVAVGQKTESVLKDYLRVEGMETTTASGVRKQADAYSEWVRSEARRRVELLADAWCAAFVMKKAEGAAAPVTNETFSRFRDGVAELPKDTQEEVRRLGREFRFCHWWLKFPGVFGEGLRKRGFDLVIGNPPWERIKIADKEWFASRSPEVANARNASERGKKIAELVKTNPGLHAEFEQELRRAEGSSKFVLESARYPLCGRGDVNTYTLFTELARQVLDGRGRVGVIVPTGIATDATTQFFFQDLVEKESLQSLFDFENREGLFPAVDSRTKFCAITLRGPDQRGEGEFAFFLQDPIELREDGRRFRLGKADFALLNPNTKTCPIFRSQRDAELTKKIYQRVPVLWDEERKGGNPWGIVIKRVFDMNKPEVLSVCVDARGRERPAESMPMFESKMMHQYQHRFGDYRDQPRDSKSTQLPDVPLHRLQDPSYEPLPRYWIPVEDVDARLRKIDSQGDVEWTWPHDWLLAWRDICRSTDERTVIASVIPRSGTDFTLRIGFPGNASVQVVACLLANLNAFVFDYSARQMLGGTHLSDFVTKQLPALNPAAYERAASWSGSAPLAEWLAKRVLELSFTSTSLRGFARALGHEKEPFALDSARRFQLRCELDAAFFHLYGLTRDEVDYVMDTFPIVRRHDEKEHGDYRTKLTILDLYDQMSAS